MAVCEQRRRRVDTSDVHVAGGFPRAGGWVIELGTAVRVSEATIAKPAGDQHLTVGEQRSGVVAASYGHAARSHPLARGRVVELGSAGARSAYWGTAIAEPASDQHLTVREQRGSMVRASGGHAARGSPLSRSLVIQLGAGENCGVAAPGNQHFTVREQRGGMAGASGGDAASGSPGIGTPKGWDGGAREHRFGHQAPKTRARIENVGTVAGNMATSGYGRVRRRNSCAGA